MVYVIRLDHFLPDGLLRYVINFYVRLMAERGDIFFDFRMAWNLLNVYITRANIMV